MTIQRAYISDGARPVAELYCHAQAAADMALAEIRKILSVAEPKNYPSSCGPGYWSAFEIGEQYPNTCPVSEYGEALAEALATFINASVE